MRITRQQIRKLVREAVGRGPSSNPWMRGQEVEVDDQLLEEAAQAVIQACEAARSKNYKSAYMYDPIVRKALDPFMPQDKNEGYAFLSLLTDILEKRANMDDWYDGAYAARRAVEGMHAWSTPGFAAARQASAERGDW